MAKDLIIKKTGLLSKKADLLTKEELEVLLPKLDEIISWAKQVQAHALQQALSGVKFEGFKVVEGRSIREFTNQLEVAKALNEAGYSDEVIYERKMQTVSAIEKLLGKKTFKTVCGPFVEKPKGKPALALESDPRPNYSLAIDDFEEDLID